MVLRCKMLLLVVVLAGLALNSCGYRFSGEGGGPKPGLQRIAIPVFENETSEAGFESLFTSALRREFILRSRLQVVPVSEAEAIFRGRIKDIFTARVAQREVEQTVETRLYVTVEIRCEDAETGEILWQNPNFTYYRTYSEVAEGAADVNFENRRLAEAFLAEQMSIRIHDQFLSNF